MVVAGVVDTMDMAVEATAAVATEVAAGAVATEVAAAVAITKSQTKFCTELVAPALKLGQLSGGLGRVQEESLAAPSIFCQDDPSAARSPTLRQCQVNGDPQPVVE